MHQILRAVVVTGLLAGAAAGVQGRSAQAQMEGSSPRSAAKYVDMVNRPGDEPWAFRPVTLTVRVGTRVTWRNRSSEAHTVTATGNKPAFDSSISNPISPKRSWSHLFKRAGTYAYYCYFHPYMKGKIVVRT